jgi:hypothetical protein
MATNNSVNNASPNIAAHSVVISEAASPQVGVLLATGQVLVGVTGGDPVAQTLANVNTWVDQTSTSVTMAVNTGYVADNAGLVTLTLPATAALGSVFEVVGKGAGGWAIAQATGQSIHLGSSTTTTTTGSLASTNAFDCVRLVCITANTAFSVASVVGNITVA